jgi:hypothetical protein
MGKCPHTFSYFLLFFRSRRRIALNIARAVRKESNFRITTYLMGTADGTLP